MNEKEIKAEAVAEFAKRLKRELLQYDEYDELYIKTVRDCIDFIAQDLIGRNIKIEEGER